MKRNIWRASEYKSGIISITIILVVISPLHCALLLSHKHHYYQQIITVNLSHRSCTSDLPLQSDVTLLYILLVYVL